LGIFVGAEAAGAAGGRILVNCKSVRIFNRVFEVPESAKNAENLTENGTFETHVSRLTMSSLTIVAPYAK
jgi:hypothetical protein